MEGTICGNGTDMWEGERYVERETIMWETELNGNDVFRGEPYDRRRKINGMGMLCGTGEDIWGGKLYR